jgi:hypothetical protein
MAEDNQDENDVEFAAMQTLYRILRPLGEDGRVRVLDYVVARLDIPQRAIAKKSKSSVAEAVEDEEDDAEAAASAAAAAATITFSNFAELHDAAQPKSNPDKALVAGYWLQVCQGAESFDSQSANTALKHLGEGLANITSAIDSLKNHKPSLALQLKKSGKTRQARKTYKITVAGVKAVENMIRG